jgi:hypothetical protein
MTTYLGHRKGNSLTTPCTFSTGSLAVGFPITAPSPAPPMSTRNPLVDGTTDKACIITSHRVMVEATSSTTCLARIVKAMDNTVITQPKLGRQELINIPPENYDAC